MRRRSVPLHVHESNVGAEVEGNGLGMLLRCSVRMKLSNNQNYYLCLNITLTTVMAGNGPKIIDTFWSFRYYTTHLERMDHIFSVFDEIYFGWKNVLPKISD